MTTYVLIFMFSEDLKQVLLVLKARPSFMPGLYNGLGGVVNSSESLLEAVAREWLEESGRPLLELVHPPAYFKMFGKPTEYGVVCYAGSFRGDLKAFNFTGKPDEPVCVFQVDQLPKNLASDVEQLVAEAKEVLCQKS